MRKMAVVGCGLIGGSMALSWKKAGIVNHVMAYDLDKVNLKKAKALCVADEIFEELPGAIGDADIVVVSVPVLSMLSVFSEIAPFLKKNAIITDVGSTRLSVIQAAKEGLGDKFSQYAPAHPIAGGELPGVQYASSDLFDKKVVILTPAKGMEPKHLAQMKAWWEAAGARVMEMSPQEHDEIFACVSHLPHILAYALVDMIAQEENAHAKLTMAGAGFRDFTRIASSSPIMWRDICLANKEAISNQLKLYRKKLDRVQELIDISDGKLIEACFENAMKNRRGLVFPGK